MEAGNEEVWGANGDTPRGSEEGKGKITEKKYQGYIGGKNGQQGRAACSVHLFRLSDSKNC